MKTLILLSMLLSSYSWAQGITLPEGISSEGNIQVVCENDFIHPTPTRLEVSNYGEGKIRVSLFASHVRTVQDKHPRNSRAFSLHYVGIENGLGSYDLYPSEQKTFEKSIGEIILHKTSVSVNFFSTRYNVTTIKFGDNYVRDCHILKTDSIRFNAVKPKCFNRRGKEISCPDIRF